MSQYPYVRPVEIEYGTEDKAVYTFFNSVYAWMCVGLAVTATVAWLVSQSTSLVLAMNSRGVTVAIFLGAAVISWFFRSIAEKLGPAIATVVFLIYAALIGAALSYIFLVYRLPTIGGAFLMTAGTFGVMSLYGFVTKRDLSRIGSILVMCAVGLFLASLVNIFLASSALSWVITYAVLAVFIGLTAYHTQMLREIAVQLQGNRRAAASYAIVGSLILYVDFINIFVSMLRILGSRR